MINRLSRSLSFRLLVIFLVLGGLFVFGTFKAIQRFYNSDEIRGLISGHLSLHVNYVREDIGVPPRIDRAIAITERVPVDIRILGPSVDWASDPAFPRLDQLDFGPSPRFSDDPAAWADPLRDVDFAGFGDHNFLRMRQGGYDIVVATPRIAGQRSVTGRLRLVAGVGQFGRRLLLEHRLVGFQHVRLRHRQRLHADPGRPPGRRPLGRRRGGRRESGRTR